MRYLYALITIFLFHGFVYGQGLSVSDLRVDNRQNPFTILGTSPKFSWKINSNKRNTQQISYRILVSENGADLQRNNGTVWDSKELDSSESIKIDYRGKALTAGKTYYWKVQIKDNYNRESRWSEVARFGVGLRTADWNGAKWITNAIMPDSLVDVLPKSEKKDTYWGNNQLPIIRKDFKLKSKKIKEAKLFISGLGHFEASLNGEKIGDHFLDAGWAKFDKEALYVTFDLTDKLKSGANTIGVMLGNGFYYIPPVKGRFRKQKVAFGYPKMIAKLKVDYTDGSSETIVTDESWKTANSPITFSSLYGGEDFDANLVQANWNKPGFNDKKWKKALVTTGPELHPQITEPVKVMDRFSPKSIHQTAAGNWIYDLGQNASGVVEISVKGKKGDTVRVYPGELLAENAVTQKHTGSPYYFQYVLKGDGVETWQPRFTYYGFRYLEVRGAIPQGKENTKSLPVMENIIGLHIRNSAQTVGSFNSSNTVFNQTDRLIDWAIRSNSVSVFTDCPHREKLGWLEQTHLMGPSLSYNYDFISLFKRTIQNMMTSQTADGLIPEIAPEFVEFTWGGDMFRDSPEWGSAGIIVPWYLYKWYGDEETMKDAYPMMKRYVKYLEGKAENHILKQGLGDWFDLGPKRPGVSQLTPMGVTGTAIFYYDLNILKEIAMKLGHHDDARYYTDLAEKVKKAFNGSFFNLATKQYATGSQTANAMAIYMNLVDEKDRAAVLENIIKDIRTRNNAHTAGDIGYRYLLRVLEEAGRSDVIFDMNSRSDVPGYGYQIAKGATALTESWEALPNVSNNHFMLGHLMEWFYSGLAGIGQEESSIAFNHVKIAPQIVGDVKFAKGTYQSVYGEIVSDWKIENEKTVLNVQIPANAKATVYLPIKESSTVLESGKALEKGDGVTSWVKKADKMLVEIGSGSYQFTIQ
ncbi:family 78 glycoside hydrolase catalytic domain [Pseudopedobacter sp.]|uniref:family 78 glycoside hydrolase catalytic domain n=1 Tax=Pseudopedobacter sp. TaxID=1936787 RepID=UPI00333F3AD6